MNLRPFNPEHDYLIRKGESAIYTGKIFEVIKDDDHYDNYMSLELVNQDDERAQDVSMDIIWNRQGYFRPATKEELGSMFKYDPIYQNHVGNTTISTPIINDSYELI